MFRFVILAVLASSAIAQEQCHAHNDPDWIFDSDCCSPATPCQPGEGVCHVDDDCVGQAVCGDACPTGVGYTIDSKCCQVAPVEDSFNFTSLLETYEFTGMPIALSDAGPVYMPVNLPFDYDESFGMALGADLLQAGIHVRVQAGRTPHTSSVSASGHVLNLASERDLETYGLYTSELSLGRSVYTYFGKWPTNAYTRRNSRKLYRTYGWQEVTTRLIVLGAEILDITSTPIILKETDFHNNINTSCVTYTENVKHEVTNSASSSWSTGGEFTVGQSFSYNVGFLGTGVGGETSFSYSQNWGVDETNTHGSTIGSSTGVQVELCPGESAKVKISASHGSMRVRVRYRAIPEGCIAVNYEHPYRGHHFWCLPVRSVIGAIGYPTYYDSSEIIQIGYYHTSHVEVLHNVA